MSCVQLARLLPAALALLVGLVSLRMAWKGLSAREWLPFHATAAGAEWRSLTPRLRSVLLFLVRIGGLGFLIQFLLLAAVPASLVWGPDPQFVLLVLGSGSLYCVGLALLNRRLHRETGAVTPWKASLAAAGVLALAALLSVMPG
jgi:hypothetical protein